jgi:hypothetical protein
MPVFPIDILDIIAQTIVEELQRKSGSAFAGWDAASLSIGYGHGPIPISTLAIGAAPISTFVSGPAPVLAKGLPTPPYQSVKAVFFETDHIGAYGYDKRNLFCRANVENEDSYWLKVPKGVLETIMINLEEARSEKNAIADDEIIDKKISENSEYSLGNINNILLRGEERSSETKRLLDDVERSTAETRIRQAETAKRQEAILVEQENIAKRQEELLVWLNLL